MPPKSRKARAPRRCVARRRRTWPMATPHQEHVQQHDRLDHRPLGNVIAWASAGHVGFKGSRSRRPSQRRRLPERSASRAGARHAQGRRVREGPGLRVERTRDPVRFQAAGLEVGTIQDVTPAPHNGCASQAAPGSPSRSARRTEKTIARYTGADCKRCRREKMKLFLKGAKCESPKCPIEIRPYPPGEHGRGRTKESEYLLQMREKQKCARIYGVLEKQFRGYYDEANRKQGKTGDNLLRILETRIDNVVYRAGFAKSRDMARQLVRHGHITVNGHKVDIPSYRVSENDIVEVRQSSARAHALHRRARRGRRADGAGVDRGHPQPDAHPRALPPGAAGHRHARPGAADRRALLEVAEPARPVSGRPTSLTVHDIEASYGGRPWKGI